jgi:protein-disulfide isomerase
VEYASLSCPHCSHFYVTALPELTKKYIDTGEVKLVYRNYPLNDPALKAAELVECSEADRRHAFIKVLFTTQMIWAYDTNYRDALANIAVLGGIDRLKFESCMNDKAIEKKVVAVAKEAADDYKINSTPTFFINGTQYKGDHDVPSLSKVIDAALAQNAKK